MTIRVNVIKSSLLIVMECCRHGNMFELWGGFSLVRRGWVMSDVSKPEVVRASRRRIPTAKKRRHTTQSVTITTKRDTHPVCLQTNKMSAISVIDCLIILVFTFFYSLTSYWLPKLVSLLKYCLKKTPHTSCHYPINAKDTLRC